MGKRAREKKMAKLEAARTEKAIIEARKSERFGPQLRYIKRVGMTLVVTVFLLWLGSIIVERINQWVKG